MEVNAASNPTEADPATKIRKTRGRQRIEIKKLEDKSKRQVTFSKRRKGLFKKAQEIKTLCGADIAILILSSSGKLYKNDNAEAVVDRFLAESADHSDVIDSFVKEKELPDEEDNAGGCRFWWDQPVENLSLVELVNYVMALKELRDSAATRLEELSIMNSNCLWQWVSDQNVSKAEFVHQHFTVERNCY